MSGYPGPDRRSTPTTNNPEKALVGYAPSTVQDGVGPPVGRFDPSEIALGPSRPTADPNRWIRAKELAGHLRTRGVKVRLDVEQLRVGDDYVARLSAAVLAADFLVPIISKAWQNSRWCHQELSLAMAKQLQRDGRVRVLPWRLGNAELPPTLAATHCPRVDPGDLREMARVLVEDARDHLCGHRTRSVSSEVARRFLRATLNLVGPPPAPERMATGTGSSPSQMEFMKARDEMRKALRDAHS